MKIPTIDDFIEATLDEMQEMYDRAIDSRIAQEIEDAREAREGNHENRN